MELVFKIRSLEIRVDTKTLMAMDRGVISTKVRSSGNPTVTTSTKNINKNYRNFSNQNVPPHTRESKIEAMIDQVFEGQQKLMVNVNGKIDDVYIELNAKFETLNTHVKKLETQVVQTKDAVKRLETFIKDKGDEALKYHVNAIIDDDFWQVVKEEKL